MQNPPRSPIDLDQEPELDLETEDVDLDSLLTEAEDGLTPPLISDDPEHDRMIDPED